MKTENNITINNKTFSHFQLLDEALKKGNDSSTPQWEQNMYRFLLNWCDETDFIIQKTSGSTGVPKEINLKKSAMTASAIKTLNFFQLKEEDVAWLCLPVDYIAGKMMVVRAIVGKLNLLITDPKGTPGIPQQTIDFTAMVPLQMKNLIEEKADLTNIKKLIIGGAEVDYTLRNALKNIQTEVYATYGMTETCSHIALQRINGKNPDKAFHVLNGISITTNEEGCLIIFYPEIFKKPIQTNDLVEIVSPAEFKLLGRVDNVINSGGLKISPEEMEAVIQPLIHSKCIISQKVDQIFGSRVVLVIEGKSSDFDSELLLQKITELTGKHKAPKEFVFVKEFPRNTSMKIDRKQIEFQLNQTAGNDSLEEC
jgi:o-succinylbenzoate---CoA ligase